MRGRLPKVGTYEGTGAALSFDIGFKPLAVLLTNTEDGDVMALHIQGMTADTAIDVAAAVAGNANNGITLTSNGFKVGTDYSESGKTFFYIAF
jgi:hypothetical protein